MTHFLENAKISRTNNTLHLNATHALLNMHTLKWIDPLLSQITNGPKMYLNKKYKSTSNSESLSALLAPISWLHGTWRTVKAVMDHPKLKEPFLFDEIISFTPLGEQPLFYYTSVATNPSDNNHLLHLEVGHLFINAKKDVGLLAVHKFGCTTTEQGKLKNDDKTLELFSCDIGSSKFIKKPLAATYRIYTLNPCGQLTYKLALASNPDQLIDHIWCVYEKRVD